MTAVKVNHSTQRIIVNSPVSVSVINAGPVGAGIPGLPGQDGEPGTPGDAPQSFHHLQNDLSDTWPVPHMLGYKPSLADCEDDAGTKMRPGIEHVDNNNLLAHFIGPCRGTADFS